MISRRGFLTLGAGAAAGSFFGAADAFAIEPYFRLTVKEWTVGHKDWPVVAPPLKIGVLTDIHAVEPWMPAHRIEAIAARMNALNPDVIVLLGDYVNALKPHLYTGDVPIANWMSALRTLRAPLGVYAVLGNHDWWAGEVDTLRVAFEKAGIHLLENEAVMAKLGGASFWIAGLGDQLVYKTSGVDDLSRTLRHVPEKAPVVLLAHEPYIFDRVPRQVTLTLAGHTHGGQVYIPFVGRPALKPGLAQYAYGHIRHRGKHMVVSSGLGLSGLPVRFMVPPEIALVTLTSKPEAKPL
jgi:predicted MPP superfamily phosphohydrolase